MRHRFLGVEFSEFSPLTFFPYQLAKKKISLSEKYY